jgi:hypothetical protein
MSSSGGAYQLLEQQAAKQAQQLVEEHRHRTKQRCMSLQSAVLDLRGELQNTAAQIRHTILREASNAQQELKQGIRVVHDVTAAEHGAKISDLWKHNGELRSDNIQLNKNLASSQQRAKRVRQSGEQLQRSAKEHRTQLAAVRAMQSQCVELVGEMRSEFVEQVAKVQRQVLAKSVDLEQNRQEAQRDWWSQTTGEEEKVVPAAPELRECETQCSLLAPPSGTASVATSTGDSLLQAASTAVSTQTAQHDDRNHSVNGAQNETSGAAMSASEAGTQPAPAAVCGGEGGGGRWRTSDVFEYLNTPGRLRPRTDVRAGDYVCTCTQPTDVTPRLLTYMCVYGLSPGVCARCRTSDTRPGASCDAG